MLCDAMWCYVMLCDAMWCCTETTAPRPLPEPFHLASTRSLRLDWLDSRSFHQKSSKVCHRSGLMTSDDFCERKARVKLPQLSQSHCHILSHIVTFSWPPYYSTCPLSTPLRRLRFSSGAVGILFEWTTRSAGPQGPPALRTRCHPWSLGGTKS